MTEMTADTPEGHRLARAGEAMLSRGLFRARAAILWERLWPALASMATAAGLFLALSWLGLWLWLPPIGRAIGVGRVLRPGGGRDRAAVPGAVADAGTTGCGGSTVSACCRTGRRPPSPTRWRPRPATSSRSRSGARIWSAPCARRARSSPAILRPGFRLAIRSRCARWCWCWWPRPSSPPAASASKRVAAAFDWHGVVMPANYRIDAWVTPPAYTGRPPMILPGLRPGEQSQARSAAPVTVPAGSTLVVRATGRPVSTSRWPAASPRPRPCRRRAAGAEGHRGEALHHHRRRQRHREGRRRERHLAFQRHPGPSADHRARQGAGAAAARLAAAQLQARGRLRRGRRAGDVRAQGRDRRPAARSRARCTRRRTSRWCCRRRAPATAPARPPRTCPSIRGPAST